MHTIAITNQKGGVAKTTTAISVASSLARQGFRVLAIDLDPQGNLGMGTGYPRDELGEQPTLFELLTGRGISILDAARTCPFEELDTMWILPAGPRLAQAEQELLGQIGFDEILKCKLRQVEERFDYVVLDCPPALGALTINAIGASDMVLVPVQCEYFSARGVVKLLDVVDVVRERRNPGLKLRVVPTLYDRRNNICRAVHEELQREFGHEVVGVTIGVDTRIREAQASGMPINLYAPQSRATKNYDTLAKEITSAFAAEEQAHVQAA